MTVEIVVIRHGQTPWTISARHTGTTDQELTAFGEEQARGLGPVLSQIDFAAVFVSPLLRARRTCELAGLLGRAQLEPRLMEWNYGDFEGLTRSQIRAQWPDWDVFQDGCPGGESVEQISARVDAVLSDLKRIRGRVAVFSHGHLLRAMAARWIGLPVGVGHSLLLGPASTGVLTFEHQNEAAPAIALWNADCQALRA